MTKLLILLVVVLGILAIAQLARVYELTAKLRGKREEDISPADNRFNARLMLLFLFVYFGFFLWLVVRYKDKMLPLAASTQGEDTDALLNFNWVILLIAFTITNVLLFWFAFRYVHSKDRRAHWFPHRTSWEVVWTAVPATVLAVIIIYGLTTWNRITTPPEPGAIEVELYAKQFDWTARYPGKDGVLGATDFRLINATNPLGIATPTSLATRLDELEDEVAALEKSLANDVLPDGRVKELEDQVARLRRHMARIINLQAVMEQDIRANGAASPYLQGSDDIVTKEFHLPVRKEAKILIRSRDVIHSAYIPHLRIQMNAVPGMTTWMKVTPTITTDSMRTHVMKDPAFDFVLLCNKICGASHYNMQMPLTVSTAGEYDAWYADALKKPFETPAEPAPPAGGPAGATTVATLPAQQGTPTH